jgi:uncharacterized protein
VKIALLCAASCLLAAALELAGLPAGLLLGPMTAAIIFAARGHQLALPPFLSLGGQAIIGLLIATSLNLSALEMAAKAPAIFLGGTGGTLAAAVVIGWLLARWKALPGSVAIWGSMPGAATAMVLMARDDGSQWQLVAVMSYLRVILVAALASTLAVTVTGHAGGHPPGGAWFPEPSASGLLETFTISVVGIVGGRKIGLPAAALLGPMVLGAALQPFGIRPQLPGWLLAPAYLLVGWRIGLGFTPEIVATAKQSLPRLFLASSALIGFCALCGVALARLTGKDLLTAYLAMSPGGADSVAIIASSTPVDVPFVMSMQILRFVAVLLIGPPLARHIAKQLRSV